MRFFYGDMNGLRALEEAEFWKQQESEHTQVIQEIIPDLEEEYVSKLNEYKHVFDATHGRLVQYIETFVNSQNLLPAELFQDIMNLVNLTIQQSQVFVDFLGRLIKDSEAVSYDPIAQVVINHIRRESEYYIGVVTAFLNNNYTPHYY